MVLVALDHPARPVQMGGLPLGLIGQGLVRIEAHAVGFDIGLVDEIEPVSVAEFVPPRDVGIMARPDGVDVEPLHQPDVLDHKLFADDLGVSGVVFVPVHAADADRNAVDPQKAVPDLHVPESGFAGDGFNRPALGV